MPFRQAMPFVIRPRVYCNAAQAYFSAVQAAGSKVRDDRRPLYDDLIVRLGTQGIWSSLDRLPIFAAEDSVAALVDVRSLVTMTAAGSPTFTADRGYTGTDGSSTVYIDSGFNPSTAGGNYTQNAAHISVWANSDVTSGASGGIAIGLQTNATGSQSNILPEYNDGKSYYRCNDVVAVPSAGIVDATSLGHRLANRSGAAAQQGYKNAVDQSVVAVTSAGLSNGNFMLLGSLTTPATHATGDSHQISAASIGGSLSASNVAAFYGALRAYMTAVGVP